MLREHIAAREREQRESRHHDVILCGIMSDVKVSQDLMISRCLKSTSLGLEVVITSDGLLIGLLVVPQAL